MLPHLDQALTALILDLEERGLLDDVAVLMGGEFGRTPRIGDIQPDGRSHWPEAGFLWVAGGGLKTGQVIGQTDARGEARHQRTDPHAARAGDDLPRPRHRPGRRPSATTTAARNTCSSTATLSRDSCESRHAPRPAPAPPIAGVLPIAHTPFTENDAIDEESLAREIDWAFAHGPTASAPAWCRNCCGSRPTSACTSRGCSAQLKRGRGVFFAGIGAESTAQAVVYGRAAEDGRRRRRDGHPADDDGAARCRAVPNTSRRSPSRSPLPLIVQDASSYVGREIPLSVSIRLLDEFGPDKILFKPEANPLGPNLSLLRDGTKRRARIYEGSGGIALVDSYRRGIAGTMPGMEFLPGDRRPVARPRARR